MKAVGVMAPFLSMGVRFCSGVGFAPLQPVSSYFSGPNATYLMYLVSVHSNGLTTRANASLVIAAPAPSTFKRLEPAVDWIAPP